MSSSSARAKLSIVIGSNGAPGSVERCLEALDAQLDVADEVLVCEPGASPDEVRRRFPFARFLERPGGLVPELWRDGLDASDGELVALTISPLRPAADWVATARSLLAEDDVVAGAIEPGEGLRLVDWAEYFCRYATDMKPFARRENAAIPGDNCAYRRDLLGRTRGLWADGFWEPEVNRKLRAEGVRLWHDPALVVHQGRSAGFRRFARQRLVHGREYGRQRGRRFSTGRNVAGVALAPAVPLVLAARTARAVFARGRNRGRFVLSLPALLAYDTAWAAGEALGHADVLRGQ
jgi:hypothetical protein